MFCGQMWNSRPKKLKFTGISAYNAHESRFNVREALNNMSLHCSTLSTDPLNFTVLSICRGREKHSRKFSASRKVYQSVLNTLNSVRNSFLKLTVLLLNYLHLMKSLDVRPGKRKTLFRLRHSTLDTLSQLSPSRERKQIGASRKLGPH